MDSPELVLPSDLSTWTAVQEYLMILQAGDVTPDEMVVAMLRIYDICNVAPASGNGDGAAGEMDESIFDDFRDLVQTQFSSRERNRFLSRTLPCMARYAVALGELRPTNHGRFDYCLRSLTPYERHLDRRFLASVIANIFFSTFPRRPVSKTGFNCPDLVTGNVSFTTIFGDGKSALKTEKSRQLLKKVLNYFDVLDRDEPCGHLDVYRQKSELLDLPTLQLLKERKLKPLSPVFIMENSTEIGSQGQVTSYVIRDLDMINVTAENYHLDHPELIPLLLFCEKLGLDEFLHLKNVLPISGQSGSKSAADSEPSVHFVDRSAKLDYHLMFREVQSSLSCLKFVQNCQEVEGKDDEDIDKRTSSISSKSSNLERMADVLTTDIDPLQRPRTKGHKDKARMKTLAALSRGNEVTNDVYKRREFERFLAADFSSKEDETKRKFLLENWCHLARKRSLSQGSNVLDFDLYSWAEFDLKEGCKQLRFAQSFESVSTQICYEPIKKTPVKRLTSKDRNPLWIVGNHKDTLRFLVQWLAASLADVPLLILQQPPPVENPSRIHQNLAINAVCAEADKSNWTSSDLLAIISRECFTHNNESIEDCACRLLHVYG